MDRVSTLTLHTPILEQDVHASAHGFLTCDSRGAAGGGCYVPRHSRGERDLGRSREIIDEILGFWRLNNRKSQQADIAKQPGIIENGSGTKHCVQSP